MSFRHKAIYGQTGCGKTWLLKRIAKGLVGYKQKVLVFTASGDISFAKGCKITACEDTLEQWLGQRDNFGAHVMLDEASVLFDETRKKTHPNIWNLFNMGRHKGFTGYVATQLPTHIPRKVRVNCQECYCFRLGDYEAARMVWADYNRLSYNGRPMWEAIQNLPDCKALHIIQPDKIAYKSLK